jgi:hypothetical protein
VAWEERGKGRRYYYRSQRSGDRVVKEYFGAGVGGDMAAADDDAKRQQFSIIAEARHAEQRKLEELEHTLAKLDTIADTLTRATLAAAGFHQHHRGEWRKRRE